MGIPRICPALMETFRLFHGDLHSTGVFIMHNGAAFSISVPSGGPNNRRLSLQGLAKNRLCAFLVAQDVHGGNLLTTSTRTPVE